LRSRGIESAARDRRVVCKINKDNSGAVLNRCAAAN
jgi:hypothetical protein